MIDFHSHVLPGIDDGAADEKTAAAMLAMSVKQGVEAVVMTPHYYYRKDIDEFIQRREEAYTRLKKHLDHEGVSYPKLIRGAEVKFSHELLKSDGLEKLFIEGTNLLLLEMPFNCWNSWMFDKLFEVSVKKDVNFIIAHAERYVNGLKNFEKLRPVLDMNFIIQVNADSVYKFSKRRIVKRLFEESAVCLVGSDMHNIISRRPMMDKAFRYISHKYGKNTCNMILSNEKYLLK